jgi:DnaK suppressor protein
VSTQRPARDRARTRTAGSARAEAALCAETVPSPRHEQLEHYRQLLTAKRAELLSSLEGNRFDTIAGMGRVAEEDQAMLSHEEFISLRRNSLDFEMLRLVEKALERIDSGEYGVCQECDEEISEKRLLVLPWAEYCVGCQDQLGSLAVVGRSNANLAGVPSHW